MGDLGVNWANFLVQLVAFLLFIWLFWRYALGPIVRNLDQRQAAIREGVESARRMEEELRASQARNEQIMDEARREAQQILASAREVAEQNIARSVEAGRVQEQHIIARAQQEIANEVAQARIELRREVADLAVEAASRIVRANLDRSTQIRLVEETLAEADRRGPGALN
jgi:F-type H+-transporting ATPase subunit b